MYLIPALISCTVLAAHFLRWRNFFGFLAVLAIAALALAVRREWSLKLLQGMLFASPFMWAFQAFLTATQRMAEGRPFVRACLILAAVAAFSAWSAFLLSNPKTRSRFGR